MLEKSKKFKVKLNVSMKPEDFIETADKINDIVEKPVGNTKKCKLHFK